MTPNTVKRLGPSQLAWCRKNIKHFEESERVAQSLREELAKNKKEMSVDAAK